MVDVTLSGQELARFQFPVERGKIREFATSLGISDAIHCDPNHARKRGYPDVLMPTTFPCTFPFHMSDGNGVMKLIKDLGMNPARSVHGETEFRHRRHVCAGEVLQGAIMVGEIYHKPGVKGGNMTFVELNIEFRGSDGELACEIRNTFIEQS
jgi:hypothetical protein